MYYSEDIIEEVRNQNDLVDVVSEYVRIQKKGSSYFGLCPFHNEDTPSFSVSPDKQMYYCFGCQAGGNIFTFIMQMENFGFVEAIRYLADRANIHLPEADYSEEVRKRIDEKKQLINIHKESAKYFYANLRSSRGQAALNYLIKREIKENIQKLFGIGYSNTDFDDLYQYLLYKGYSEKLVLKSGLIIPKKSGDGYIDRFRNRIMFPIFDVHNQIIGFGGRVLDDRLPKYMNSPETPLFDKSKSLYSLNYARVSRQSQILIVEGYMDVISLYQAGFTNVTASLGTAFTYQHAALLKRYTGEVVLIYDSDNAGTKAALRAIPILSSVGLKVRVMQVPGEKDPDDFIKQNGPDAFKKLLDNAMGAVMFQVQLLKTKYNTEDTEQKIQFTKEVAKIISKLDNSIERDAYLQEITKDTGISTKAITDEVNNNRKILKNEKLNIYRKPQGVKTESKNNVKSQRGRGSGETNGLYKAQLNILHIISSNPSIYQKIKPHLSYFDFSDPILKKAAQLIYEQYDKGMKIQPATIINYFEDLKEQQQISLIFREEKSNNQDYDVEKAINDQIKLIKRANIDIRSRTTTDIYEIQSLIEQKKQLERLYINIISG
ncbi:MAG: DNA primase [Epulopiscium sp.]|nr:DNA primase [Candidatus Epulonipiscium sp.]